MSNVINQTLTFSAPAQEVYEVLTTSETFQEVTGGAPTDIDPSPGGAFSCFGGMIAGRTIEAEPGVRLVQAWRAKTWEPGVYSIVRFELTARGDDTELTLVHTGFPEGQGEHLAQGWHANYWEPLEKHLAS